MTSRSATQQNRASKKSKLHGRIYRALGMYSSAPRKTLIKVTLALAAVAYFIVLAGFIHAQIPHAGLHVRLASLLAFGTTPHGAHTQPHGEIVTPGGGFGAGSSELLASSTPAAASGLAAAPSGRVIHADVVALDQPLTYNRFGSVNPYGMMYALKHDVVKHDGGEWIEGLACPGRVKLREDKRPRPLVLRGNVGDILEISFTNLLLPEQPDLSSCKILDDTSPYHNLTKLPEVVDAEHAEGTGETQLRDKPSNDWPLTRSASITIQGMRPADGADPRCLGLESLPAVGGDLPDNLADIPEEHSLTCRWHLDQEGAFLFYSHGAPAGGEGDGGSLVQGLFGTLNVEPAGSHWFRSQVTQEELDLAWERKNKEDLSDGVRSSPLDYHALGPDGTPVLNILKARATSEGEAAVYDIMHGDLNAIIWEAPPEKPERARYANDKEYKEAVYDYAEAKHYYQEAPAFREFTAIFHDELKTFYTDPFAVLEEYQLEGVGDGFGINYGASGMGSLLLANRLGIGPSWDCKECLYEEFFLQSWANGDPALLEEFFDDPSNVYHSYLNDRVRFRNLHAGPKETHVFHLHAHQWLSASDEDAGSYLDSQTIGPLQGFEYEVYNGGLRHHGEAEHDHTQGSGNRNRTPGDSIFHCHLYPHFAQGMWSLWRVHDVLEDGTRRLPDGQPNEGLSTFVVKDRFEGEALKPRPGTNTETGEQGAGTPVPAVVPLPDQALPPLPTYGDAGIPGYPFYIPGEAGHRAPQPPLDFVQEDGRWKDGGLPRHVFGKATRAIADLDLSETEAASADDLVKRSLALGDFSAHLETAEIKLLPNEGSPMERRAMAFHAGQLDLDEDGNPDFEVKSVYDEVNFALDTTDQEGKPLKGTYDSASPMMEPMRFTVNGSDPQPGAPFADPCEDPANDKDSDGQTDPPRVYNVSAISLDLVVNKAGWHDPQARINVLNSDVERFEHKRTNEADPFFFRAESGECITYYHTNRTPKDLHRDDFQVKTPTDIIGQHIHLVKFDVTSSDGSANGWNYEDGTLAPDAVLERKCAGNAWARERGEPEPFEIGAVPCPNKDSDPDAVWKALLKHDDLLQTTAQRWFADPILTVGRTSGQGMDESMRWMGHGNGHEHAQDRTMRTVFTHDHFAPSSIQQHGFYSALLIEPAGSEWFHADGTEMPEQATGWEAIIRTAAGDETHKDHREFALAVADFALLYDPRYSEESEQGMGRLVCEAVVAGKTLPEDATWLCPQEVLDEISKEGTANNASVLNDESFEHLISEVESYWLEHGRPVDPPLKPEAISKNHHNPYLVNYKHEPLPLRVGELTLGDEQITGDLTDCGMERVFERDEQGHLKSQESVRKQRADLGGDMAFVFSTDEVPTEAHPGHGDPCTPILEAYEGEQVQIRLIQGAQEVQHMFTVEGLRWPRVIDQDIMAKPTDEQMAKTDNVANYVAAHEVGISEHFEAQMPPFDNIGGGREATDYLYHFGTVDALWNGAWGLIRTYDNAAVADTLRTRRDCKTEACVVGDYVQPLHGRDAASSQAATDPGMVSVANRDEVLGDLKTIFDPQGNETFVLDPDAENFCPDGSVYRKFYLAATRFDLLGARAFYDPAESVFDPDGLILLPLPQGLIPSVAGDEVNWDELVDSLRDTYGEQARNGDLEPLVIRINAGDCVRLEVYNALLSHEESLSLSSLPDKRGDALMPRIVPLNVDQSFEERLSGYEDLASSARLSLSIPLVHQDVAQSGGMMVGKNKSVLPAAFPPNADDEARRLDLTFYAGLIDLVPENKTEDGEPICPNDAPCPYLAEVRPYAFGPIPIKAFGDVVGQGAHGLFGAVVVEPKDAIVLHPETLECVPEAERHTLGLDAVVVYPERMLEAEEIEPFRASVCNNPAVWPDDLRQFRDFVVFYQDGLNLHWPGLSFDYTERDNTVRLGRRTSVPVEDCLVCDDSYDLGEKGVSYRSAPFWARLRLGTAKSYDKNRDAVYTEVEHDTSSRDNLNQVEFPINFFSPTFRAIPTPTYFAREGEKVRFRVVQPQGRARQRAFTVYGHHYDDMLPQFGSPASALMSAGKVLTAHLTGPDLDGDGTPDGVREGCYLYRDGPSQMFSSGVWGSFIVAAEDGSLPECAFPAPPLGAGPSN